MTHGEISHVVCCLLRTLWWIQFIFQSDRITYRLPAGGFSPVTCYSSKSPRVGARATSLQDHQPEYSQHTALSRCRVTCWDNHTSGLLTPKRSYHINTHHSKFHYEILLFSMYPTARLLRIQFKYLPNYYKSKMEKEQHIGRLLTIWIHTVFIYECKVANRNQRF